MLSTASTPSIVLWSWFATSYFQEPKRPLLQISLSFKSGSASASTGGRASNNGEGRVSVRVKIANKSVDAAARATAKQPQWTRQHENILADWADKAACYRWLYTDANQIFSRYNTWFTIPVIIMSTLTGTANFAQERVPLEYRPTFSMIVGCMNITAEVITTIQQFLKIAELNESHRVASISWDKLYRNIRVELAKHPEENSSCELYQNH
ncbi:hypothetical protein TrLO_g10308 [Triparma laevis f. longispina]|uniref:Uncharacterized protein n=1 Tax=Triparma laevis f. longispina TaxID=1714387 RepID=A0A9W7AR24_9STRA|nr:hypothetical protein TrLO_g10308 [Triparma laevis f. longispina]